MTPMQSTIHACFIVDDTPINGTYWQRLQQTAFGYKASETGWATQWRTMAGSALWRVADAHAFADMVEALELRGKFTFLPCPGGLGRVDRAVRGYGDAELKELIAVVRDRIAPAFDITPEVLTHSMAIDPDTGALLPHGETAWLSHLCNTRQADALRAYIGAAYTILRNVGLEPRGLTTGGMEDLSGIAEGRSVLHGHGRDVLGEALLAVEREVDASRTATFLYTGSPPGSDASRRRRVPERIHTSADGGAVFEIHSIVDDPIYPVLLGPADRAAATTDALVTADLSAGLWIDEADAGRVLCFTVHAQTLMAQGTGAGLSIIREACRRLRDRYGQRLVWHTATELCALLGQ